MLPTAEPLNLSRPGQNPSRTNFESKNLSEVDPLFILLMRKRGRQVLQNIHPTTLFPSTKRTVIVETNCAACDYWNLKPSSAASDAVKSAFFVFISAGKDRCS